MFLHSMFLHDQNYLFRKSPQKSPSHALFGRQYFYAQPHFSRLMSSVRLPAFQALLDRQKKRRNLTRLRRKLSQRRDREQASALAQRLASLHVDTPLQHDVRSAIKSTFVPTQPSTSSAFTTASKPESPASAQGRELADGFGAPEEIVGEAHQHPEDADGDVCPSKPDGAPGDQTRVVNGPPSVELSPGEAPIRGPSSLGFREDGGEEAPTNDGQPRNRHEEAPFDDFDDSDFPLGHLAMLNEDADGDVCIHGVVPARVQLCDKHGCKEVCVHDFNMACALNEMMDELIRDTKEPRTLKVGSTFLLDRQKIYDKIEALNPSNQLVDTGADVHLMTLEDARKYLRNQRSTTLNIIGVSGVPEKAAFEGELFMNVEYNGRTFEMPMGVGYASNNVPKSLISAWRLLRDVGGFLHFEQGNTYYQPRKGATRIPLIEKRGLFYLPLDTLAEYESGENIIGFAGEQLPEHTLDTDTEKKGSIFEETETRIFARCFGAESLTPALWHRRFAHALSPKRLKRIQEKDLVHGLKMKNHAGGKAKCSCDECQLIRLRANARQQARDSPAVAQKIGDVISTDVKVLPNKCLSGYRYIVVYRDHFTPFGAAYPIRNKNEVVDTLDKLHALFKQHGHHIKKIQSDRGTEYFAFQDADHFNDQAREELAGDYTEKCRRLGIEHSVRPVAAHEMLAEQYIAILQKNVDSMLFDARLSPCFAAHAYVYASFLRNITPCERTGITPFTMFTDRPTSWNKVRVFGSSVYHLIPNNKLHKTPGLAKGQHMIFVGFHPERDGYLLFDPSQRRFVSGADNVYFYEDFTARKCHLRAYDARRNIAKKGGRQPLVINDNNWSAYEKVNNDSVRNIYDLYEDSPEDIDDTPVDTDEPQQITPGDRVRGLLERLGVPQDDAVSRVSQPKDGSLDAAAAKEESSKQGSDKTQGSPRSIRARARDAARKAESILSKAARLRPVRLAAIGKPVKLSEEDKTFIDYAIEEEIPVKYLKPNPKSYGSKSYERYMKYMVASTLKEAKTLTASRADINFDYARGWILFPKHESRAPGHIVHHASFAKGEGQTTLFEDAGLEDDSVSLLGSLAMLGTTLKKEIAEEGQDSFREQLISAYDLVHESIMPVFNDAKRIKAISQSNMRKLMLKDLENVAHVNLLELDTLAEEPDYYGSLEENGCKEWKMWKKAREEEFSAMEQFGAFEIVPRSSMRYGTRPLTSKWVHKLKTNEFGEVTRAKARLVCRGFLQRPFDTYHPDEIYAPVASHEALRVMIASACIKRLNLYQADISNAYLQAPLRVEEGKEVYMEPPPGIDIGKDNIFRVVKSLYGSKNGAADFHAVLSDHLINKMGFERCPAEPSLFRRVRDGQECMIATYVDDLSIACKNDAVRDQLLAELRERFFIKDGEGERIRYLLGVKIDQDHETYDTSLSQEVAIEKIAKAFLSPTELAKADLARTPALLTPLEKQKEKTVPDSEFHMLSALGSLLYVSGWTRPDVAVAVTTLCRHAATPGEAHVKATKRVISYLYSTKDYGLKYYSSDPSRGEISEDSVQKDTAKVRDPRLKNTHYRNADWGTPEVYAQGRHPLTKDDLLETWVDSDYGADISKRSMKGIVAKFAGGPVSWTASLNKTVSLSTAEAEVAAALQAGKDVIHLKNLLAFIGLPQGTILLREDNQACAAQIKGGLKHVRKAKHYAIWLHWLQQQVVERNFDFCYCPTQFQLADAFTKNLAAGSEPGHFHFFRDQLVQKLS